MSFQFDLPMIIDGISSCNELTADDPDNVCCEKSIINEPNRLYSIKSSFVKSGVTALLSPTECINHTRLEELCCDNDFVMLNTELTKIVKKAGSCLPVGAVLTHDIDNSSGELHNAFEDSYFSYLEKITVLKDAGASFILLKDCRELWDMRAGTLAAKALDMPVFVTMTVDDDGENKNGTDYIAALITMQALGADAFGILCREGTGIQTELLDRAFSHAEIPLIAVIDSSSITKEELKALSESGASVYIDTSLEPESETIAFIRKLPLKYEQGEEKDSYAAAIDREAFFLPDVLELSDPIKCDYDMSEELIDFDDESINAIYVPLYSTDDAAFLADNATMTSFPFAVHTDDPVTLEAALRYFQGRLIIDSNCGIDESIIDSLSKKYGAILY